MLLEFLFDLFFEGLIDASGNPKIPKAIRYILFSIVCLVPISIGILCCFSSYEATGALGVVASAVITAFLLALWIFGLFKIKKRKQ